MLSQIDILLSSGYISSLFAGNLGSLQYLSAGENNLLSIPREIGLLGRLESFYINDNANLHNLPYELTKCSQLQIMSIENCPLREIPGDIVAGGPALIIQYLKVLHDQLMQANG